MFSNSTTSTSTESPEELLSDLYDESDTDTILFSIESDHGDFDIQAVNFRNARDFHGFNVCSMDHLDTARVANDVPLEVEDHGNIFVLFPSNAANAREMADELEAILTGVGGGAEARTAERQELDNPGRILSWLHEKLGV